MNILQVKKHYHMIIEQTKFTYSSILKAFEKQIKTIEEQGKKTNRCYYKSKRKTRGFYQQK